MLAGFCTTSYGMEQKEETSPIFPHKQSNVHYKQDNMHWFDSSCELYFKANCNAMKTAIEKGTFDIDKGLPAIVMYINNQGSQKLLKDIEIKSYVHELHTIIIRNKDYDAIEDTVLEQIKKNISVEERLKSLMQLEGIRQKLIFEWLLNRGYIMPVVLRANSKTENLKLLNANQDLDIEANKKKFAASALIDSLARAQVSKKEPLSLSNIGILDLDSLDLDSIVKAKSWSSTYTNTGVTYND